MGIATIGPFIACVLSAFSLASTAIASDSDHCNDAKKSLEMANNETQIAFRALEQEAANLRRGVTVWSLAVSWERQPVDLQVPHPLIGEAQVVVALPQLAKSPSDVPGKASVRMERVKTGQYPEIKCGGGFLPICHSVWHDVYTEVPKPAVTIAHLTVASVTLIDTRIELPFPEVAFQRVGENLNFPKFNFLALPFDTGQVEGQVRSLKDRIAKAQRERITYTIPLLQEYYTCYRNQLLKRRADVEAQFDAADSELAEFSKSLAAQGISAELIKDTAGKSRNLTAERNDLAVGKAHSLKEIDRILSQLVLNEDYAESRTRGRPAKSAVGTQ
jgi:hypothetical protein